MARRKPLNVNAAHMARISDEPCPPGADAFEYRFLSPDVSLAELWRLHGADVTAKWIKERPGTRPTMWWRFDAPRWKAEGRHVGAWYAGELPEPRRQVGGVGTPAYEVSAYKPDWPLGISLEWADYDEANLPTFESQAEYLKRHNLIGADELERVPESGFVPEVAPIDEDEDEDEGGVA
jgi:hypothetical protein